VTVYSDGWLDRQRRAEGRPKEPFGIDGKNTQKICEQKVFENQLRRFLTVELTGSSSKSRKFMSKIRLLSSIRKIEWG
jgi:hypothetical protein